LQLTSSNINTRAASSPVQAARPVIPTATFKRCAAKLIECKVLSHHQFLALRFST
jgi:hypothetical protein